MLANPDGAGIDDITNCLAIPLQGKTPDVIDMAQRPKRSEQSRNVLQNQQIRFLTCPSRIWVHRGSHGQAIFGCLLRSPRVGGLGAQTNHRSRNVAWNQQDPFLHCLVRSPGNSRVGDCAAQFALRDIPRGNGKSYPDIRLWGTLEAGSQTKNEPSNLECHLESTRSFFLPCLRRSPGIRRVGVTQPGEPRRKERPSPRRQSAKTAVQEPFVAVQPRYAARLLLTRQMVSSRTRLAQPLPSTAR